MTNPKAPRIGEDARNSRTRALVERHKDMIRAAAIIRRLESFVLQEELSDWGGKGGPKVIQMTPHQVTAALGLLRKVLPDLKAIEMQLDEETRAAVLSAKPITESQWLNEYAGRPKLVPKLP